MMKIVILSLFFLLQREATLQVGSRSLKIRKIMAGLLIRSVTLDRIHVVTITALHFGESKH